MLEILQFCFSGFWTFWGCVVLFSIVLGSICYAVSRFSFVRTKKVYHNDNIGGLTQDDKQFLIDMISTNAFSLKHVCIYQDEDKFANCTLDQDTMYFVKVDSDKYNLITYNSTVNQVLVHKQVDLVNIR